MDLRWYQKQAVAAVWDYLGTTQEGSPCVVLPTGSGKTFVIAELCRQVVEWGGRALILAHVKELLAQASEKLRGVVSPELVGIYSAGLNERTTNSPIVVAGIQSVFQRAQDLGEFHLIIVDEAHLIPPSGTGRYRTFLEAEKGISPKARLVGLTATPYRLGSGWIVKDRASDDDGEYDRILDTIIYEAPIARLIDDGTLSRVVGVEAEKTPDFSAVHTVRGDFDESEIEKVLMGSNVLVAACQEIAERTKERKKVVVFCNRCESAREVAKLLNRFQSDGEAVVVDGETPDAERDRLVRRFKGIQKEDLFGTIEEKPLKYVCNVGVLTTGFDAPNVDCVVLLRPTKSLALYQQMVGRGLRTAPDKRDCLVLDFGGNVDRHGPIDLANPETQEKKTWRKCPKCGTIDKASYSVCWVCGYAFPTPNRTGKKDADPNKNLEAEPSKKALLSNDEPPIVSEFTVKEVSYSEHHKKNGSPDDPATLQIRYDVNETPRPVFEWLCPEHEGWIRKKFERWWQDRSATPLPTSAAQAARIANDGGLATPIRIQTTKKNGDKFARVEWLEQSEIPDPSTVKDSDDEFVKSFGFEEFEEFAGVQSYEDGAKALDGFDPEEPVKEEPSRRCSNCNYYNDDGLETLAGFCRLHKEERLGTDPACGRDFTERYDHEDLPF